MENLLITHTKSKNDIFHKNKVNENTLVLNWNRNNLEGRKQENGKNITSQREASAILIDSSYKV